MSIGDDILYLSSRWIRWSMIMVTAREEKGLQIATLSKVVKSGSSWIVPSQSGNGARYTVDLESQTCTCPDHEVRHVKCKHIYAVEYTLKREVEADGTVTETETIKVARVTYSQNWTAYNAAQMEEKARFGNLLADLCKMVPQPAQENGRPRLPLSDMVFACAYKVYTGFSSRRFTTDIREAALDGLVAKAPHFNSVSNYLSNPALTPILQNLITASSLPMKVVETNFAVDSSGFSTSRFVRWFNKKYGREVDNKEWVKVHLTCGVNTHIVTAVEVSGWSANDTTYFQPLIDQTARYFTIGEVSADKAYLSKRNLNVVDALGGTAFIPFKSNSIAHQGHHKRDSLWEKMWYYYNFNRESFLEHYHQRSNVESVFSMVKAKFGDSIRSKSDEGQVNEVLCKVLCHNIAVLIQSIHELGIEPTFCAEMPVAQKVAV
jgi:transposase